MDNYTISTPHINKIPKHPPVHAFWKMAHKLGALSESDRIEQIKIGFTIEMAEATKQAFRMTTHNIGSLLNLSVATLERRRKDSKPLDIVASERLDRIATIALQAESVFENSAMASDWMSTPNTALGGSMPIMHCETSIGARQVRRILNALEWGGVA